MLKNILNLDGAQHLTKTEQKSISGGNAGPVCPATHCHFEAGGACIKRTAITAPMCID